MNISESLNKICNEATGIEFERVNDHGMVSDKIDGKKITPRDITDAKQEYEATVKELTDAIQKITVYGTSGQRLNAWKLATNTIKELLPTYEKLFDETLGK